MSARLGLTFASALLVLLTAVPRAGAAPPVSPKALVLHLADLPAGFTQATGRLWTNAQAAAKDHRSVATYIQIGRLTSYETVFTRQALVGIASLDDTVIAFKTPQGAHWYLQQAISSVRGHMHTMSAGHLGDEAQAFTLTQVSKGISVTADAIVFRRRAFAVRLIVGGLTNTFQPDEVFKFAQILDHRLQHAG